MEWKPGSYDKAEIEKKAAEFAREAMLMAKRAEPEPEIPEPEIPEPETVPIAKSAPPPVSPVFEEASSAPNIDELSFDDIEFEEDEEPEESEESEEPEQSEQTEAPEPEPEPEPEQSEEPDEKPSFDDYISRYNRSWEAGKGQGQ